MAYFGDGQCWVFASEEFELVTGADLSFFDDRKIEATTAVSHEALDHVVPLKFDCEFETRKPWCRYPDHSGADAVAVANGNVRFEEPLDSEVLAEGSPGTRWIGKLGVPCCVVFTGIAVDGFVRTAVHGEVGLAVAIEISSPQHDSAFHGVFENTGFES